MRTLRLPIIGLIIICSMIAACSRKRAWTGPKLSGRLLVLAQDGDLHSDLIEIRPAPDSTFNYKVIVSDVFAATVSPDQTRLLYSNRDGLFLRELRTGDVEQVVPSAGGTQRCLAWSPDSKRFSFRSSESQQRTARASLFVSDLEDNTQPIWESWVGGVSSECDVHWIAPDRLIFDRVLRATPQQEQAGEVLLANTTSVATLGDPVKFVDTDKAWSIDEVCQFGNAAVVRPQHKDYPVFVAKELNDLKTLKPSQACADCRFAGFAAKSCVPWFISSDFKTGSDLFTLKSGDGKPPKATHINQVFSVTAKMMIDSSAALMVVGSGDSLLLVDTTSGKVEPFFPKSFSSILNKKIIAIEPIGWFEN